MHIEGICHKMRTRASEPDPTGLATIDYKLVLEPFETPLNPHIGKPVQLSWNGKISCVSCGATTAKSYAQGHCYKCLITKASCDMCMVKPETCHHHLGTCREPGWAEQFCFNPHTVYLSNTNTSKVGMTRFTQMPTRWIDQGAHQALPVLQTSSRFLAGVVETLFAQNMADKTDWRAMLKSAGSPVDLQQLKDGLLDQYAHDLENLRHAYPDSIIDLPEATISRFEFPVLNWPKTVKALSFDKTATINGTLEGIKGQYLLLDTGVLNLRKFSGYHLQFNA